MLRLTLPEQKIRMLEQVQLMNDEDPADSVTTESLAREIEDMVAAPGRPESEAAPRMLKHVARASDEWTQQMCEEWDSWQADKAWESGWESPWSQDAQPQPDELRLAAESSHPPSPEAPKAPSQCAAGLAALPPTVSSARARVKPARDQSQLRNPPCAVHEVGL